MSIIGSTIRHTHTIKNSLEWARHEFDSAQHGTLFCADVHLQPRGRQGRAWLQEDGQLLLTFVLKPTSDELAGSTEQRAYELGMALSLGILHPLELFGVGLKWPNDFVVGGKKMGGMIIQAVWRGANIQGFIVGCGLNISTHFLPEHPLFSLATSLSMEAGRPFNCSSMQQEVCDGLNMWYYRWQQRDDVFGQWKNKQTLLGKSLRVHTIDGVVQEGELIDVCTNGDAMLETVQGIIQLPFSMVDLVGSSC